MIKRTALIVVIIFAFEGCSIIKSIPFFGKKDTKEAESQIYHSDIEKLQSKIDKGYKFIAYGDDMLFLAEKLNVTTEQLTKFK